MYFNLRLWGMTKGLRTAIFLAAGVGLIAISIGIARLALTGVVIARLFQGEDFSAVTGPLVLVGVLILLRGLFQYVRDAVGYRTATRTKIELRRRLYQHLLELGPGHFDRRRTGDILTSLVDGVESLEVFFGQYLPQFIVAAVAPVLIFVFMSVLDIRIGLVFLVFALVTLFLPAVIQKLNRSRNQARRKAYGDLGADFLDSVQGPGDAEGLRAGGSPRRASRGARADAVSHDDEGARGRRPVRGGHGPGHIGRRGRRAGLGRDTRQRRADGAPDAAHHPDAGRRGVQAAARAGRALSPGHGVDGGCGGGLRAAGRPGRGARPREARRRRRRARARGEVRGRRLRVRGRAQARAPERQLRPERGRGAGRSRPERCGQVDARLAAAALLRPTVGARHPGRARRPGPLPRHAAQAVLGRDPGHLHLPGDGRRQSAPGQAGRDAGRDGGGRARRERPRVHLRAARRLRHPDRGARRQAVGRRTPAAGDSPGAAEGGPDTAARRGAVERRLGERGGHPGGTGAADGRQDDADHRAPSVERRLGRPHPGAGPRPVGGDRQPRGACRGGRRLRETHVQPAVRARGRPAGRDAANAADGSAGARRTAQGPADCRDRFRGLRGEARQLGADLAAAVRSRTPMAVRARPEPDAGTAVPRVDYRAGRDERAAGGPGIQGWRLRAVPRGPRGAGAGDGPDAVGRVVGVARPGVQAVGRDADRHVRGAGAARARVPGAAQVRRSGQHRGQRRRDDRVLSSLT